MDGFRFHRGGRRNLLNGLLDGHGSGRLVIPFVIERIGARTDYAKMLADQVGRVFVQRTGVGFLLGHAHFGEQIENALRLNLELSRQLINPDFAHSWQLQNGDALPRHALVSSAVWTPDLLSYQIRFLLLSLPVAPQHQYPRPLQGAVHSP